MLVNFWVNNPHYSGIEGHFINKETPSFVTVNKVEEKVPYIILKDAPLFWNRMMVICSYNLFSSFSLFLLCVSLLFWQCF
jgi:hypothetical protein